MRTERIAVIVIFPGTEHLRLVELPDSLPDNADNPDDSPADGNSGSALAS